MVLCAGKKILAEIVVIWLLAWGWQHKEANGPL
jgi:hypothetical protein